MERGGVKEEDRRNEVAVVVEYGLITDITALIFLIQAIL